MPEAIGKLACGQCGRNYAWKPEYAGRSLKCKCGATIKAPAAAPSTKPVSAKAAPAAAKPVPVAAGAGPADIDDIEQMLSQAAEYDVKDEPAPPPKPAARVTTAQTVMPAGGVAVAAAATGPGSPLLGYARTIRKPVDEGTQGAVVTDFYVPLVLIALGLLVYYFDARLYGIRSIPVAGIFIVFKTVINLALVFIALLIGVQLIDLGLGPIGPALLKIAAVALLPAALSDIIGYYTMGLVPWIFSALMYGILLYVLFEMEYSEIAISTGIIWFVQTWVGMLLVGLLLGVIGAAHSSSPSKGASAIGSSFFGPSPSAQTEEPEFDPTPEGQDKRAEYWIENKKAVDAREWLKPEHDHAGVRFTTDTMLQWTEKFYAAGAKKVWAADFYELGKRQAAHYLLVEMPTDKAARAAVLKLIPEMDKTPDFQEPDDGARYLYVSMGNGL